VSWAFIIVGLVVLVVGAVFLLLRNAMGRWNYRGRRRMALPEFRKYLPPGGNDDTYFLVLGIVFVVGGIVLIVIGLVTR
jgi:UPF0716 family protein affecting phage T7 exclusion